jgi:hypothetical protein
MSEVQIMISKIGGYLEIKLTAVGVTLAQTSARAALLAAAIVDQGV